MACADLVNQRFGRLTVTGDSGQRKRANVLWSCRCDCGGETTATRQQLVSGSVQSCGCLLRPYGWNKTEIGQRFGMLTVTGDSGQRLGNSVLWSCRCDCGGETTATRQQLASGKVQSCGCLPRPDGRRKNDLVGQRFGRLTVTGDSGQRDGTRVLWSCRCDCGGEITATRQQLAGGKIQSCGCAPKHDGRRRDDLVGRRFGRLTVVGDSGQRRGTNVYWSCRCDCGGERLATRQQLVSGTAQSCGCLPRAGRKAAGLSGLEYQNETCSEVLKQACADTGGDKAADTSADRLRDQEYQSLLENAKELAKLPRRHSDLTGQRFGRLTVVGDSGQRRNGFVLWLCRCDCGGWALYIRYQLTTGRAVSCGCLPRREQRAIRDLTGQRFGRLTVLELAAEREYSKPSLARWRCRCDCGNETVVTSAALVSGNTRSCGCIKNEQRANMSDYMHYSNGTCLERLVRAQKTERNKAGFRGLSLLPNGEYQAKISFQKVTYNLGYFHDFDEAVQARLDAERILHQGFIDAYNAYRSMAEADPAWAEENPFFYEVQRIDGSFTVHTNGASGGPLRSRIYMHDRENILLKGETRT